MMLLLIALLQKKEWIISKESLKHIFILGLLLYAVPWVFAAYGACYASTAMAAVIQGATPLFTVFFSYFWLKERMTLRTLAGVTLGLAGLAILYFPQVTSFTSKIGMLLFLITSACFAFAAVYVKRFNYALPPIVTPAYQLAFSMLLFSPIAVLVDPPCTFSLKTTAMIGGVSLFCTVFSSLLYYDLIQRASPKFVSLNFFFVPLLAAVLGIVFLNEPIEWNIIVGGIVILCSASLVQKFEQVRAKSSQTS